MTEEESISQITSFLSALSTEIQNIDYDPITESAHDIFSKSNLCSPNNIRCICGVDIQIEGEELVKCSKCKCDLHRSCLEAQDISPSFFVCPICQFQSDGTDPLKKLSLFADKFNSTVLDVSKLLKKGDEIYEELPSKVIKIDSPNGMQYYDECFSSIMSHLSEFKHDYQAKLGKLQSIDQPVKSSATQSMTT